MEAELIKVEEPTLPPNEAVDYLALWDHERKPRKVQRYILDWLSGNGKHINVVEAPTGVGKSWLCTTVAKDGGGIICTPQISLQEQYLSEFPHMALIKSAANYRCDRIARVTHGTVTDCKKGSSPACAENCPYQIAKSEFCESELGTSNYAYFWRVIKSTEPDALKQRWIILDECVPADASLHVIHEGAIRRATMGEVIGGVGSKVLSDNEGKLEFRPITNRFNMGPKELVEVVLSTASGRIKLLITENGRVKTQDGYKVVSDLALGDVATTLCPTYSYERMEIAGKAVRVRMREAGAPQVGEGSFDEGVREPEMLRGNPSTPAAGKSGRVNRTAKAVDTRDAIGRRLCSHGSEPRNCHTNSRDAAHSTFNEAPVGLHELALRGAGELVRFAAVGEQDQQEAPASSIRGRSGCLRHSLAPIYSGAGDSPPWNGGAEEASWDQGCEDWDGNKDGDSRIPGPAGRLRAGGVVDGRRLDVRAGDPRVHLCGTGSNPSLAPGAVGYCEQDWQGPQEGVVFPAVRGGQRVQASPAHSAARNPEPVLQVQGDATPLTVAGVVVSVRRTGEVVETYDIEVEGNHNFYADGVLIHNCHHLESSLIDSATVQVTEEWCKVVKFEYVHPTSIPSAVRIFLATMDKALKELALASARVEFLAREGTAAEIEENAAIMDGLKEMLAAGQFAYDVLRLNKADEVKNLDFDGLANMGLVMLSFEGGYSFKPLYATHVWKSLPEHITSKRFLLMSATILDEKYFMSLFGWDESETAFLTVPSPFEVDNRKVYLKGKERLNRANIDAVFHEVVEQMDEYLDRFKDDKGVIHTHSFRLAALVKEYSRHRSRLLVHEPKSDREKLIEDFLDDDGNAVIVSPSMTEGLDLKGDLGRFSFFMKVPYPSLGDPWVKARMKRDGKWYSWQVAKTIIQGAGRVCRSRDDWGYTVMFDAAFNDFLDRDAKLFPDWFLDAVRG